MNVYEECPVFENDNLLIRMIEDKDAEDLLAVYSDLNALPFFNSDNCHGSNFYITNMTDMENTIKYWLKEYYEYRGFVRFSIIDKRSLKCFGTIEMFHRIADDGFNHCGVLRLDLRSDYERAEVIGNILDLIIQPFYDWFDCERIITKACNYAVKRVEALRSKGFVLTTEALVGNERMYYDYWVRDR